MQSEGEAPQALDTFTRTVGNGPLASPTRNSLLLYHSSLLAPGLMLQRGVWPRWLGPASTASQSCPYSFSAAAEMGVAPPAGAGIYGFAELPTPYAAHHLDPQQAAQRQPFSPEAAAAEAQGVEVEEGEVGAVQEQGA